VREYGIGRPLPRSEDIRLVQGRGRYTDDFAFVDQAYLYIVRSPHAAANIRAIDTARAKALPGVLAVLTGEDVIADGLGTFPCRVKRQKGGKPNFEPPYRALAVGRARHVGDAVVAIIAETLAIAKDAAELVAIDYEPLPSVTATAEAAKSGAPAVWDEVPDNVCFFFELGDRKRAEEAFTAAAHVARTQFTISRVIANPIEPRNAIGLYDAGTGRYTLYTGTQAPHSSRAEIAELVLKIPENRLRIVSPDCGGAFGMKEGIYPELILVLWGAVRTGRPVRWQAERSEAFLSDHQARDNVSTAELALDATGRFLALRVTTTANLGAYLNVHGPHSSTNNLGGLSGTYRTPHIYSAVTGVFSHTPPTAPYRGAGRPEASYAIERVIDVAAREMRIDRAELRRRNMIPPSAMPYKTGFVFTYDSGEFEENMNRALALSRWTGFEKRRKEAAHRGKLRGIGLASVIEIAGGPPTVPFEEFAEIRFDPGGSVTIFAGTHSQGQGHETAYTQMLVELLGVAPEQVRVVCGDTDAVVHGKGTFGSRSASVIATALSQASAKLVEKGKLIAGSLLEVSPSDIEFKDGRFVVSGTDRTMSITEIARASYKLNLILPGIEPGFAASVVSRPAGPTFPNGCHVCEVEIDVETGTVEVVGYCVVDDVGRVVNPLLAKGQVHGGVAHGLGQVLREQVVYDRDTGQLVTGSFMDYAMPRASDLPPIEVENNEVLARTNPFGIKGAGEAGCVGALPAVMNAICDALAPLGIREFDMPATADRVWRAIREARASAANRG
jgi:carbon-monoxide dehydrogenase large subunit